MLRNQDKIKANVLTVIHPTVVTKVTNERYIIEAITSKSMVHRSVDVRLTHVLNIT